MATNVAIDDRLLLEAQRVGGHLTKEAAVNEALKEYIQQRKQVRILELFGTIDFDPKYDHKKQRRKVNEGSRRYVVPIVLHRRSQR
jgi:hypothetical protein